MLKYQAAALALKAFSVTPQTRRIYRRLGNWRMNRHPSFNRTEYLKTVSRLIVQMRTFGDGPLRRVADLGTGWAHFYGLTVAAATGAQVDLYDVWDNRQWERLRLAFTDQNQIAQSLGLTDQDQFTRLERIAEASTFDDLYRALGARYVVDPGGVLAPLASDTYDVVFSADVLEHVHAPDLPAALAGQFRVLRPGGIAVHEVGVDDHLTHYDRSASKKQYLAYSDGEWKLRFENGVQYFNRTSFDEFRRLFTDMGFEEVVATAEQLPEELAGLKVSERFRAQSQVALEAVRLFLVYRKPYTS